MLRPLERTRQGRQAPSGYDLRHQYRLLVLTAVCYVRGCRFKSTQFCGRCGRFLP